MAEIFDGDGNRLGDIVLSDNQIALLAAGENVNVMFHTPQLFRQIIGEQRGSFLLTTRDGRISANDKNAVLRFIALQKAIKAARTLRGV